MSIMIIIMLVLVFIGLVCWVRRAREAGYSYYSDEEAAAAAAAEGTGMENNGDYYVEEMMSGVAARG